MKEGTTLNKYESIEIVSLEDVADIYDIIGDKLIQLESDLDYIAVYAKRDLINTLFIDMISDGYEFGYADFDMMDEMLKDSIYLMIIRSDCVISIEPAYNNKNMIIEHDAKSVIISMDDCNQRIIDYCLNNEMDVVLFDFDVDNEIQCDKCECRCNDTNDSESTYVSRSEDGIPEGFCKSWFTSGNGVTCYSSYRHYSNDVDTLREIAKVFGVEL